MLWRYKISITAVHLHAHWLFSKQQATGMSIAATLQQASRSIYLLVMCTKPACSLYINVF